MQNASVTIPGFTQIQQSCEMSLQEWAFGRTFQAILKEVSIAMYVYVYICIIEIQQSKADSRRYCISIL